MDVGQGQFNHQKNDRYPIQIASIGILTFDVDDLQDLTQSQNYIAAHILQSNVWIFCYSIFSWTTFTSIRFTIVVMS